MKEITKELIKEFKLKQLGYDFMGYPKQGDIYTAHHLIVPAREGGKLTWDNTVVLRENPHNYVHLIENKDFEVFSFITSEMLDMKIKGYLDPENLRYIDDALSYFEREHCSDRTKKGKILIKDEFLNRKKFYR